jgi:phosphoribosylaminoimidazole-succinocarboxamide synthase
MTLSLADKEAAARAALDSTLERLEGADRSGKVRDIFDRGDEIILVASDRVSAFDRVLGTVPFKGSLLTEQACFWLDRASAVIPTHLIERVDAQAMRCHRAEPLACEIVIRGHLAGSLQREPAETRGHAYGLQLDPGMGDWAAFDEPIVTPTTKAEIGTHDEPCSLEDLVAAGIPQAQLDAAVEAARGLFALGRDKARERGLILVDTKYEFGVKDGEVILIDEIHTADSSRYWVAESYEGRIAAGEAPEMLDKERLRRSLLELGYSGDGEPPALSAELRVDLSVHYWDLTERLLGAEFVPPEGDPNERLAKLRHP